MKKIIILIILLILSFSSQAQTFKLYQTRNIHNQLRLNTKTGEVWQIQDDGLKFMVKSEITPYNDTENRYLLQITDNIWTFILLDRFSGKIWQCQFSASKADEILSVPINLIELSNTNTIKYSIEPMTSMYQFYLIDDETGEMWKFQWSTKGNDYRWIEKI